MSASTAGAALQNTVLLIHSDSLFNSTFEKRGQSCVSIIKCILFMHLKSMLMKMFYVFFMQNLFFTVKIQHLLILIHYLIYHFKKMILNVVFL